MRRRLVCAELPQSTVGYYNFTGYELVATGLVLVWLIVFVRNTAAVRSDRAAA